MAEMLVATEADLSRFWSKVDRSGDPGACQPWQGFRNRHGYGQFAHGGRMQLAHRWLVGVLRGTPLRWDKDLREAACHSCDNPPCCNPDHLYIGDQAQNIKDCASRGRHRAHSKTHCPKGHEYAGENLRHNGKQRFCRECSRQSTREHYQRNGRRDRSGRSQP